jgi:hypothetical protein
MSQPKEGDAVLGGTPPLQPNSTSLVLGGFYAVQRKIKAQEEDLTEGDIKTVIAHKCRNYDELLVKIKFWQEYYEFEGLDLDESCLTEKEVAIAIANGARKSFYLNVEFLTHDRELVKKQEQRRVKKLKGFTFSRYCRRDLIQKAVLELADKNISRGEVFQKVTESHPHWQSHYWMINDTRSVVFDWKGTDDLQKVISTSLGKISRKYELPISLVFGYSQLLRDLATIDTSRTLLRRFTLLDSLLCLTTTILYPSDLEPFDPRVLNIPRSLLWKSWILNEKGHEVKASLDVRIPLNSVYFGGATRSVIIFEMFKKAMAYAIALHAAHRDTATYSLKNLEQKLGIWNLHKAKEPLAAQVAAVLPALRDIIDLIIADFKKQVEDGDDSPAIPADQIERVEQDLGFVKLTLI